MNNAASTSSPRRLSGSEWEQAHTAYASGIGLREIARSLGVSENTVLSQARRKGWTRQIVEAKAIATTPEPMHSNALTVPDAVALTMQERGQRHVEGMAKVVEGVMPHLHQMQPEKVLADIDKVERFDKVSRRTFGITEEGKPMSPFVMLSITGCPSVTVEHRDMPPS